jgi:phosphoglycolate phosphatase-like HAD superfamily hydrolase
LSLVLFDIDGTLLLSGGAGVRAMTRAFETVFAVPAGFDGVPAAGHTDRWLLSHALRRHGLPDTPVAQETFRACYVAYLAEEIERPGSGRRGVMPGVESLLAALEQRPALHLALLRGNYARAAEIKLSHFGLARFFGWGVFGDEAADRRDLARLALTRARERRIPDDACARAVVVGDTPHDVACARAAGVRALAVATGPFTVEQLQEAGADLVFRDLTDGAAVIDAIERR